MAKLKVQVVVLALCLAGVLVAQHYVTKLAAQIGQATDAAPTP